MIRYKRPVDCAINLRAYKQLLIAGSRVRIPLPLRGDSSEEERVTKSSHNLHRRRIFVRKEIVMNDVYVNIFAGMLCTLLGYLVGRYTGLRDREPR